MASCRSRSLTDTWSPPDINFQNLNTIKDLITKPQLTDFKMTINTYFPFLCIVISVGPLHGDVTFGHFCICLFGHRHVGGQKCIVVIERKVLIISLLTNASDYFSKTTIFVRYKHIDLPCKSYLIGVVTCVGEQRYV